MEPIICFEAEGRRWDKSLSNIWLSWPPSRQQTFNSWARHSLGRGPSTSYFALHYIAHWVLCSLCTLHRVLVLHSVNRVLCTLCKLHCANNAQCSQFIVLIVHNFKKVLCRLCTLHGVYFESAHCAPPSMLGCTRNNLQGGHFASKTTCTQGAFVQDICLLGYICHYESQNALVKLHGTVQYSIELLD